jgi:hypothetical protein
MLSRMQGILTRVYFLECEIVTFVDWQFNEECR